jgi:hypothetical protein
VVRSIDTWTVLKLSFLFYLCGLIVLLIAGGLLWYLADQAGAIGNIEHFVKELGDFRTFKFDGVVILEISALIGMVLVLLGTAANVFLSVLYNLMADLVGGIQLTVLEEQLEAVPAPTVAAVAEIAAENGASTAMTPSPFGG